MQDQRILIRLLGPRQDSSRTLTLGLVSAMLFLLPLPGCARKEHLFEEKVNLKYMHRMRSLSLFGGTQASLILENTRELKLTTDAGQTWQVIPAAAVSNAFECATMLDSKRGWAVNNQGHIYTTDSGGGSWTKISELQGFTGANQIEFVNERDGWLREFLSLWRTRDGGLTWRETLSTKTPGVHGQPTGIFLIDANTVVGSGSDGQVYLTIDGGENWKIETPLPGDIDFNDVWFADQKHGWLTGYAVLVAGESLRPLLFETTDGGESWKEVLVESDLLPSSVCFVGQEGWLAGNRRIKGGQSVTLEGVLLHSSDGGKHWVPVQFSAKDQFLSEVRFTDKFHGWLVGRDNLYRTEDGGKTWIVVLSLPAIQSNA